MVLSKTGHLRFFYLVLFSVCLALSARATPIRPTVRQILKDAERPPTPFIPARAGWNGSETQSATVNPMLDRFRPQAQREASREALVALAIPDLRVWGMLAMIILGLRMLLRDKGKKPPAKLLLLEQPPAEQPSSDLRAA